MFQGEEHRAGGPEAVIRELLGKLQVIVPGLHGIEREARNEARPQRAV